MSCSLATLIANFSISPTFLHSDLCDSAREWNCIRNSCTYIDPLKDLDRWIDTYSVVCFCSACVYCCYIRCYLYMMYGGAVNAGDHINILYCTYEHRTFFSKHNHTPSGKKTVTGMQAVTPSQVQSIGCVACASVYDAVNVLVQYHLISPVYQ